MQSLRVAGRLESIRLGAPRVLSSCVTPERASAVIVRTKTIAKKPNRRGDTVNGEVGRMREHLQGMSARIAPRKVARADTVPPLRCVRGTRGSDTTCAGSVRISGGQTLRSRSASKGDQNPCLRRGLVTANYQGTASVAKSKKRKQRRNVSRGIAHIKATFNNTIVTISDSNGDTLCYASAGTVGFKGSRKSTPFAAQRAAEVAAERAAKFGLKEVEVRVKGPGSGRESAITALQASGLSIKAIEDVTPLPHNGCRPPKKRRV